MFGTSKAELKAIVTVQDCTIRLKMDGYIEPKPGEWIEWNGGTRPVPFDTKMRIRFRGGQECDGNAADGWRWDHRGVDSDIVAYRVLP